MTLYVAQVGVPYEGMNTIGIYESVDAAVEAIRQYAARWHELDLLGDEDYYEVRAYEVGAPPGRGVQIPAEGRQADLLHTEHQKSVGNRLMDKYAGALAGLAK